MTRTLSIDVGGTGIKALVLNGHGEPISERSRVETPYPCPPELFFFHSEMGERAHACHIYRAERHVARNRAVLCLMTGLLFTAAAPAPPAVLVFENTRYQQHLAKAIMPGSIEIVDCTDLAK